MSRICRSGYLRPKPILRIIKTMLEDKDVCIRRCREGFEFFKSLRQRNVDGVQKCRVNGCDSRSLTPRLTYRRRGER